jgi:hypothetical protein
MVEGRGEMGDIRMCSVSLKEWQISPWDQGRRMSGGRPSDDAIQVGRDERYE